MSLQWTKTWPVEGKSYGLKFVAEHDKLSIVVFKDKATEAYHFDVYDTKRRCVVYRSKNSDELGHRNPYRVIDNAETKVLALR